MPGCCDGDARDPARAVQSRVDRCAQSTSGLQLAQPALHETESIRRVRVRPVDHLLVSTCAIKYLCEDSAEALSLLSTVLAWGFRDSLGTLMVAFVGGVGGFGRSPGASALSGAPAALHLPASWLEVVLAPELLQWLLQALQCTSGPGGGAARHNGSAAACSALAAPARSVLLQLCSIKGKAVQANEGAARARAAFCVHGLLAVRPHVTAAARFTHGIQHVIWGQAGLACTMNAGSCAAMSCL